MRSDNQLNESVRKSDSWKRDPVSGRENEEVNRYELPDLERGRMSFSGKERNHLFLNLGGTAFEDISRVSGLDSIQDGRSFAIWDYDRDGWQDIALANTNGPVLKLFRNRFGSSSARPEPPGKMVALRFVGGNTEARPSDSYACRDGYGAQVTVTLPDTKLTREHRCGEGFAAQNTNYMLFGLGSHESVDSIRIQWPSGSTQRFESAIAGDLITVFENAAESPDRSGFACSRYLVDPIGTPVPPKIGLDIGVVPPFKSDAQSELYLYTSMATWCLACRNHLPELERIRKMFDESQLTMIGVPIDEKDSEVKLNEFIKTNSPAYHLDPAWSHRHRSQIVKLVKDQLGSEILPATIMTNIEGQILDVSAGVPTVSDIARWLKEP